MTGRAPKKYLDADRVEVNPDWLTWREGALADIIENLPEEMIGMGIDPAVYFPGAYDKAIPEDGCWILVLEEPHTELMERFRVPLLSMWFCRDSVMNQGGIEVAHRGTRINLAPHLAVITTPGGELSLYPHEYQVASDPYGLMTCEEAEIHTLGGPALLDEEVMFYLQSRGIAHEDAVMLMIEQIKSTDFIYVTFPEEVTAMFEGVGQPLWRHIQRHPRGVPA